jgi:Tfp pilus assembly protein PilF
MILGSIVTYWRRLSIILKSLLPLIVLIVIVPQSNEAQFSFEDETTQAVDDSEDLSSYSAEELSSSAERLMRSEQPISARTRLLAAIEKDPDYYPAYELLAEYYLDFVGHFKLALRYFKQGQNIFFKQHGEPPYSDRMTIFEHSRQLMVLSQIRLNLDDYSGALRALDEFQQYGYYNPGYYSSRAWILMKLNRLDEAIENARTGVLNTAGSGALNMLGILLSISGQPEAGLKVFDQAIELDNMLGDGHSATPLNNAGEVYRERFMDIKAEQYWTRAKSLPDGCEHVLPSLNLAILKMEHLKTTAAEDSLDSFEECVRKYTVKNDEEHRSLITLARGRIALEEGNITKALDLLKQTLARGQWFGKIGTNVNDLKIGALISYAETLQAAANHLKWQIPEQFYERPIIWQKILTLRFKSWWYKRKARFLFQSMNNMEDVYIRHSDSVVDYPKLGFLLATFPSQSLKEKLAKIRKKDDRKEADIYYDSYYAESLINDGYHLQGLKILDASLDKINTYHRTPYERSLIAHLNVLKVKALDNKHAPSSIAASLAVFNINPARLINAGVRLPVKANKETEAKRSKFESAGFVLVNSGTPHQIYLKSEGNEWKLTFESSVAGVKKIELKGSSLPSLINRLTRSVFISSEKDNTN